MTPGSWFSVSPTSLLPGKMFLVGLTGGIASGKSSVIQVFQQLGCAVIDVDIIARHGELGTAVPCSSSLLPSFHQASPFYRPFPSAWSAPTRCGPLSSAPSSLPLPLPRDQHEGFWVLWSPP